MGSSQAVIQKHPQILHHDEIISSTFVETQIDGNTTSLLHKEFRNQLNRIQHGKISRQRNPFCPIVIGKNANWVTGCLVSPVMILASPLFILDQIGFIDKKLTAKLEYNGQEIDLQIASAQRIQKFNICVLFLQNPFYINGWAGLSWIQSLQELKQCNLKMINHPEYFLNKMKNQMTYGQFIKRYKPEMNVSKQHPMALVYSQDIMGTLVFKIVQEKPYIIGIQTSQNLTIFFREQTIKQIRNAAIQHLKGKFSQEDVMKKLHQGLFDSDKIE